MNGSLPRNSKTFNQKLIEQMREFNETASNNKYIISSLHTSNNQLENVRKGNKFTIEAILNSLK